MEKIKFLKQHKIGWWWLYGLKKEGYGGGVTKNSF